MSPLGVNSILRAPVVSVANTDRVKPGGSFTLASAGLGTRRGNLAEEGVSKGGGSFARSIRWTRPGTSFFQSSLPLTGLLEPAGSGGGPPGPRPALAVSLNVPFLTAWK